MSDSVTGSSELVVCPHSEHVIGAVATAMYDSLLFSLHPSAEYTELEDVLRRAAGTTAVVLTCRQSSLVTVPECSVCGMVTRDDIDGTLSVVLPTRRWTHACDELLQQIECGDEFILACDRADDPVVAAAAGTAADVVVAGEPEGCSAKCNALAAGLERATGEYLVCTDADFRHGPAWLATVRTHLAEAPAGHVVSSAPAVVSEGPLGKLLEGPLAVGAVLTALLDSTAWGGTMAFRREAVDLEAYVADLRRTVSDDALLTQRVDGVASVPSLIRPMPVAGTLAETLARQVRWTRTGLYLDPVGLAVFAAVLPLLVLCGTVLVPSLAIPFVTAVTGLAYAYCGLRRWTFLLAVPGYLVSLPLLLYGLGRTEFGWNGRRYRWTGVYDVTVLGHDDADAA